MIESMLCACPENGCGDHRDTRLMCRILMKGSYTETSIEFRENLQESSVSQKAQPPCPVRLTTKDHLILYKTL